MSRYQTQRAWGAVAVNARKAEQNAPKPPPGPTDDEKRRLGYDRDWKPTGAGHTAAHVSDRTLDTARGLFGPWRVELSDDEIAALVAAAERASALAYGLEEGAADRDRLEARVAELEDKEAALQGQLREAERAAEEAERDATEREEEADDKAHRAGWRADAAEARADAVEAALGRVQAALDALAYGLDTGADADTLRRYLDAAQAACLDAE